MFPVKFKLFYNEYKNKEFALLDVGCGDHSAQITKRYFPKCKYHGLDRSKMYNNSQEDFNLMTQFYEVDLSKGSLDAVPDNHFDVIVFSHVIEHIFNGIDILQQLTRKVKQGGKIYVEYPGAKSLALPSSVGTLNFCDDPTHIRIYDVKEISNVLLEKGFRVLKAGIRRDLPRLLLSPAPLLLNAIRLLFGQKVSARGMWDVWGFAEFVYAQKK